MDATKIFVLVVHTGEYEDAKTDVVCASSDSARLEQIKSELEQRTSIIKRALDAMYAAQKDFQGRVIGPVRPLTKPIPKFPSNQKLITAEMRAEREAIKAENFAMFELYQIALTQWVQECRSAMSEAFRENCTEYPDIDPFDGEAYEVSTATFDIVQTNLV